jgi:hypothetical protein
VICQLTAEGDEFVELRDTNKEIATTASLSQKLPQRHRFGDIFCVISMELYIDNDQVSS